ncbi:maleylpyruvate isomerase family mycothiol-dependent enzyme [Kineococcus arenarius]|uniref:maleylpyruvate isomerase family mycothiol-dependent enzyme n=1 Tax=Kineococcus sp. SYSU DK007 TaxID=3383128 RepID=UPI003D7D159E
MTPARLPGPTTMSAVPSPLSPAQTTAAVAGERLRLADWAAALTEQQWQTPSLCPAWTVRDVLAHLTTTTRLTLPLLAREAIRARGSFDRMEVDLAAARAQRYSTAELLQQLRASAASSRRFPGSSPLDPLMDLVVHAQDIARPLHLPCSSPAHVVTACLEHVVGNRFMGAPKRVAGLHLVSTDSGWTHGTGSGRDGGEVRGPDLDLLLAISGRRAGLDALSGPGVDVLRERLQPA